jgi:outer membrane cobalamin receptor
MTYHVSAEYKPIKELVFKVGLNGMGRRYNQIVMNNLLKKVEIKGYTDMYARIDYRFMGKGRLWLQGSNLLNQKYQNWYGYNAFGITVMGGLSIGIL